MGREIFIASLSVDLEDSCCESEIVVRLFSASLVEAEEEYASLNDPTVTKKEKFNFIENIQEIMFFNRSLLCVHLVFFSTSISIIKEETMNLSFSNYGRLQQIG